MASKQGRPHAQVREETRLQMLIYIRDSRGLTASEQSFLFVLCTHATFEESAARKRTQARMGLSDYSFRKVVPALEDRGLIRRISNPGKITKYTLNTTRLKRFYEKTKETKDTENTPVENNNGVSRNQHPSSVASQRAPHVGSRRQEREHKREPEKINKNKKGLVPIATRGTRLDGTRFIRISRKRDDRSDRYGEDIDDLF